MLRKIAIRRGKEWEVKPEAEVIDGMEFNFSEGWEIEDGMYEGETAMIPDDTRWKPEYPSWIASGDLQKVKPLYDRSRPLSWSSMSSFFFNQERWYQKYCVHGKCRRENDRTGEHAFCHVKGGPDPSCPQVETTPEMEFGKAMATSIEDGTCRVPGLLSMLQPKKEHQMKAVLGKGKSALSLVGYNDAFNEVTLRVLDEVKTGRRKWDQRRADAHGQFDFYLLMNWINDRVRPEEVLCTLYWIPTDKDEDGRVRIVDEDAPPVVIRTRRTLSQVLAFGTLIQNTVDGMEAYAQGHW